LFDKFKQKNERIIMMGILLKYLKKYYVYKNKISKYRNNKLAYPIEKNYPLEIRTFYIEANKPLFKNGDE